MTKRERIEALERQVAEMQTVIDDLKARLLMVEANQAVTTTWPIVLEPYYPNPCRPHITWSTGTGQNTHSMQHAVGPYSLEAAGPLCAPKMTHSQTYK